MPSRRTVKATLNRRRDAEADIRFDYIYVQPWGRRGQHKVHPVSDPEGVIIVGSMMGSLTFKPGSVVTVASNSGRHDKMIAGLPPPGRQGASEWGIYSPQNGEVDTLGVISAVPAVVDSGVSNQEVTLTGYGFLASPVDTFTAVVYNETTKGWDADPLVTVHDVTFVTVTEVTVQVDVSASAPAGKKIHILPARA